jgi:proline iminopeptidase
MLIRSDSGPLYFEVLGAGPPLAFVSGWGLSCECWRPAVALLKQRYRCLIYDQRGIGRSQPATVSARFEIEDHSEDLHSVLEATEMFDACIIAHEMGGLVAALCADRHPQDMRALALVSPRAGVPESETRRLAVSTPASLALRELAAYPLIRNLVAWRFRRAPRPSRDVLFEDFANLSPRAAYETAISAASLDLPVLIEKVTRGLKVAPLIVCGEKDKKGVEQARRIFARIRAARLASVKDCGFLPMLEYPEQFARLIDGFLAGSRGTVEQAISRKR